MITVGDRQEASQDRAAGERSGPRAGSRAAVRAPRNAQRAQSDQRAGAHLCALAGRILGAKLVATPLAAGVLRDCKQTWILRDGAGEERAVAQLSSPLAQDMVVRGIARANALRRALDRETAAPILPTLASGAFEGVSFAIWPFCERVPNRVTDWIARRTIERPVQRWLREVTRQTARPLTQEAVAERVDRPLCAMATNRWLSLRARLAARQALRRLDSGQWRPMQVAMHGDLHAGNLLIDQRDATGRGARPWAERFVAIDFCGARASGLPLFDLVRIAESLRTPHALLAQELAAHCALLGGTLDDAPAHAAASLADLGANLECFPVDRYRELADRVLGRLDEALNHPGELA